MKYIIAFGISAFAFAAQLRPMPLRSPGILSRPRVRDAQFPSNIPIALRPLLCPALTAREIGRFRGLVTRFHSCFLTASIPSTRSKAARAARG